MKSSTFTRLLDKHLGKILCYIFSFLNIFIPKRKIKEIKNVLFIELFEMGAAIMAYPSLKYAKESKSKPNIYCLCTASVSESWEILDIIPKENIFALDDKSLPRMGISLIKQLFALRKKNIDLVIDLELFLRISSVISFMIKSKRKAGFYKYHLEGLFRGTFYDIRCAYNQNLHISKNFLALTKTAMNQLDEFPNYKGHIKTSEIELPEYKSNIRLREIIIGKIKSRYPAYRKGGSPGEKIVVLCPDVGPQLPMRNYPKESYAEVAKQLLAKDKSMIVLLVGVKADMPTCEAIKRKVDDARCINFCGETRSIRDLVELIELADLYIGNDNGPGHFASLTKTKIITLYSTDSPFVYGPLGDCVILYSNYQCSPCISAWNHKYSICQNNLCLKSIPPELVTKYAFEHLNGKLASRTINNKISYI